MVLKGTAKTHLRARHFQRFHADSIKDPKTPLRNAERLTSEDLRLASLIEPNWRTTYATTDEEDWPKTFTTNDRSFISILSKWRVSIKKLERSMNEAGVSEEDTAEDDGCHETEEVEGQPTKASHEDSMERKAKEQVKTNAKPRRASPTVSPVVKRKIASLSPSSLPSAIWTDDVNQAAGGEQAQPPLEPAETSPSFSTIRSSIQGKAASSDPHVNAKDAAQRRVSFAISPQPSTSPTPYPPSPSDSDVFTADPSSHKASETTQGAQPPSNREHGFFRQDDSLEARSEAGTLKGRSTYDDLKDKYCTNYEQTIDDLRHSRTPRKGGRNIWRRDEDHHGAYFGGEQVAQTWEKRDAKFTEPNGYGQGNGSMGNFGIADYGDSSREWPAETYQQWNHEPTTGHESHRREKTANTRIHDPHKLDKDLQAVLTEENLQRFLVIRRRVLSDKRRGGF
ncbi:hypothetical protein NM208_g13885 [Fusarium decemcellulare]|uniref:Uncharacterized protein n=1 Tax=Fusarium decemcellulare TaxID=57161 RepID=A0ACC1RIR4_9HYPO|nr:hypothetical protein NM208_g13885 [Fusarium decemcellulare]